jgi:1-phosphatidylinositol-3-phosphate 5-kinase
MLLFHVRRSYKCPSTTCETDMMDHVRRFVHDAGCVQIIMRELSEPIPVKHSGILVWNWCSRCQQISSVVPLSVDGWSLSFAKYLELRFHGSCYKRRAANKPNSCQHPLHHDHYQYFGLGNVVVSFKYYPIVLREVVLPPAEILYEIVHSPTQRTNLIEEVSGLSVQGHGSYSSILEKLHELEDMADSPKFQEMLKSMSEALDGLRVQFRAVLEDLQLLLANLKSVTEPEEAEKIVTDVEDKIVSVKVGASI